MITLDELVKEAGQVEDLDTSGMKRAFRTVRTTAASRPVVTTAITRANAPRYRVGARVGFGLAASVAVATVGFGVANLTGAFTPASEVVIGQDGDANPQDGPGEEDSPFADVSPGFYEDNGEVVWRIYSGATAPDLDARTVPSQFTAAELDAVFVRLEEFASARLSGNDRSEFFSHAYDAKTDTVLVTTNIPEDELPADLTASGVLTYQYEAEETQGSTDDPDASDGELPSEDE